MRDKPTAKSLLTDHRNLWDNATTRPGARDAILRMLACKTRSLGAEVFASANGEKLCVFHTCKSRACASCGMWRNLCWQREIAANLPDVPFAGVGLTMHGDLWPIFQRNRHLLPQVAAIAAGALQDWARRQYRADVMVLAVTHTFGGKLNFNVHVHLMVSTVGLDATGKRMVDDMRFPQRAIVRAWRDALLDYLTMALHAGQIADKRTDEEMLDLFQRFRTAWWSGDVKYGILKSRFLQYISRYLLRHPAAESRLQASENSNEVCFLIKDTKASKSHVPTTFTVAEFIGRFLDQIPDRYRKGVQYFGLLAPRCKRSKLGALLALLVQKPAKRPRRRRWAQSILETFGRDPLLDSRGVRMHWVGRLAPAMVDET
jgi:hypothetical protein